MKLWLIKKLGGVEGAKYWFLVRQTNLLAFSLADQKDLYNLLKNENSALGLQIDLLEDEVAALKAKPKRK